MSKRTKMILGISAALVVLLAVVLVVILLPKEPGGTPGETGRLLTTTVPAELWWHSGEECEACDEELEKEREEEDDYSKDYINITNGQGDIFSNTAVGEPWQPGDYRIAFLEIRNTGTTDMKYSLLQEVSYAENEAAPAGFKYVILKDMTYKLCMREALTNWNSLAKVAAAQDVNGNSTSSGTVAAGSGLLSVDVIVPAGKSSYVAVAVYYDGKAEAAYSGLTFDVKLFCNTIAQESGEQRVFYVSPNGHDGNPGTEVAPLKSFRRAAELAKPGETYIFEDGIYYEGGMTVMRNSGTADAPIIFKSRNQGGAVVIYPETLCGNHKIYIWEKEYITIEGFELTQAEIADDTHPNAKTDMIIRCGYSNNITIRNNEIHHAWEEPIKMSRGHNILIEGNYIHDGGYEAIDCVNLSDSIIRDNEIAEVGRMALMCKGGSRSVLFYNNYVHTRERTIQNAFGIGGISNNTSIWGGTPNHWEAFNVYVFNNIVVAENNGKIDYGVCFIGAKDCGAFNNILVGCNYGVMYRVPDDMNYGWEWNPTNLNIIFKNNVVMDSQQSACIYIDGDPINLDSDYNLYYNNAGTDPVEPHSIYGQDPGFVASKSDWTLKADSPLKGAGTPVSGLVGLSGESFFVGFDKNYILRGDTWDIGVQDTDGTQSHDPGGLIYDEIEFRNPIDTTIYEAPVFSSMPEAGTVLLEEDFESSTALRDWTECSSSRGRWVVRSGNLTMDAVSGRVTIRYKEGVTWSDYEYTAKVLSPSMEDLDNCSGIIFRADDEMKNMYGFRFLPGAVTNKLELCMWNNGSFSSLRIMPFEWEPGKMYELKVIAVGSDFAFYVDGEKVMTAIDGSHSMGTVGVYSYRESHLFDDVLVTSAKGTVIEQLPEQEAVPEYTGQILLDEAFIDSTVMSDWKPLRGEWKIVEETMREVGGPVAAGDRRIIYTKGYDWKNYEVWVDVYLPEEASESAGILFSYSADGSKYYGFRFVGNNTYVFNESGKIYVEPISGYPKGTVAKLKAIVEDDTIRIYLNSRKLWEQEDVETTPGTIGLYLNSSIGLNYFDNIQVYEIESDYVGSGGSGKNETPDYTPIYTGTTLMENDFETQQELTDWLVLDEAGKRASDWQIADGVLKETSDTSALGGTAMLVYQNGNWGRYEYGVDMVLPDDTTTGGRSVGVIFGSDAQGKNYYYFRVMYNGQTFFKYLYKVTPEGTERIVHEQKVGDLTPGDKVRMTVFAEGKRLRIYIDGQEVYNDRGLTGLGGSVGLYMRGDIPNNSFDNMTVKELSPITTATVLLEKNFDRAENMKNGWMVKDSSRESDWQAVDGVLKETSPADTDIDNGTAMLFYTGKSFSNYEYFVDVQLPDGTGKSVGIIFGGDESGRYYYYLRIFKLGSGYYYQVVAKDTKSTFDFVPQEKIPGEVAIGSVAKLKVVADDVGNLQLYINDIELYNGRVASTLSAAGHVGFFLKGTMPENSFDNMLVQEIFVPDEDDDPVNPDPIEPDPVEPDPVEPDPVNPDPGGSTGATLLEKDFEQSEELTGWLVADEAGKRVSAWQIVDSALKETGDASTLNGNAFLIYTAESWSRYEYSVDVQLPTGDQGAGGKSVGVVFGSDADFKNYYYLRIFYNGSDFYKYLIRVTPEGSTNIVAQTRISDLATPGEVAKLTVRVDGTALKLCLNGQELYSGTALEGLAGHIGLYLRGDMPNNRFDNLLVKEIVDSQAGESGGTGYTPEYTGNTLLSKDFEQSEELTGWMVADEAGKRVSAWQIADGVLKEAGDASTLSGNAFLVYTAESWSHYEFSVDVQLPVGDQGAGGKSVGVVFGSDADFKNYYYLRIFYNGSDFYKYLIRVTPEGSTNIVGQTKISDLATAGDVVKLTVYVEGKSLKLYMNEHELYSNTDLEGLTGHIGLYLRGDVPNNSFDNLIVKEIQGNVVTSGSTGGGSTGGGNTGGGSTDGGSSDGGSTGGGSTGGGNTNTNVPTAPLYTPAYTGTTLLDKDFEQAEELTDWLVVDEEGLRASQWQIKSGVLKETSNAGTDTTNGYTFLVYTAESWSSYAYSVDVRMPYSQSGDGVKAVGVVFGSDAEMKNYYYLRIFFNGSDFYKQLYRVTPAGTTSILPLTKINNIMTPGIMSKLSVFVEGTSLKIYMNKHNLYSGTDLEGLAGHIGLYLKGDMPHNCFDNMLVREIENNVTVVPTQYTITYYNVGSVANPNPTTYLDTAAASVVLADPGQREGYNFLGWYLKNRKITDLAGQTGDLKIEARWEKVDDGTLEMPDVEV